MPELRVPILHMDTDKPCSSPLHAQSHRMSWMTVALGSGTYRHLVAQLSALARRPAGAAGHAAWLCLFQLIQRTNEHPPEAIRRALAYQPALHVLPNGWLK